LLDDAVVRQQCGQHLNLLNPLDGPHLQLPLAPVAQPFHTEGDFEAYIRRLRALPDQVNQIITGLRFRREAHLTSPRSVVARVPAQLRVHLLADVTRSEFYRVPAAKAHAVLSAEKRDAVLASLGDAVRSDVIPAYMQLLGFIEDDYLPSCRTTTGISDLPRGADVYKALARVYTTTDTPPEEIHQIGLREVARIRTAMDAVKATIGFEGSLDEFLEHMRTDPNRRGQSAEDLLHRYDDILARTKPLMSKLAGRLPQADCVMKEIEPFRAADSPMAYYNPTPWDGSRPGYFYINTHAPGERTLFSLEALTYHEAVPGHHLQIALAREREALPKFRRYAAFPVFEEGWALYAEGLGAEIGGYRDPDQMFGRLNFEMWRACRLVVDTALHVQGWSRERAIEYVLAQTAFTRLDVEAEIDRYIAWPGQALAYKMGELAIREIRAKAEQRLEGRFDLRRFHDALLAEGALPIDVLKRRMDRWIEAETNAPPTP
jgi:prolyl oligopeptidase